MAASGSGTSTYQWQYATTVNGTYANLGTPPTGVTYSGATSATLTVSTTTAAVASTANFYRCVVTNTLNGNSCNATSTGGQLTIVTYCANTTTTTSTYISNFVTTGGLTSNISNNTGAFSTNGYGDFTSQAVNQYAGANVGFTITGVGTSTNTKTGIWVDWNNSLRPLNE